MVTRVGIVVKSGRDAAVDMEVQEVFEATVATLVIVVNETGMVVELLVHEAFTGIAAVLGLVVDGRGMVGVELVVQEASMRTVATLVID